MFRLVAFALLSGFAAAPAFASELHSKVRPSHSAASGGLISTEIAADQRKIIYDYYGTQIAKGICPPGLAKKNNGCQPPSQAKEWSLGHPLPGDLAHHPLPRDLATRLRAPDGAKYVRVAADILLIADANGMVLDAIDD